MADNFNERPSEEEEWEKLERELGLLAKKKSEKAEEVSVGREIRGAMGMLMGLGLTMVVCMGLGLVLGRYLDRRLDTAPGFLIICTLLGGAAAIKVLYDTASKQWKDED